MQKLAGGKFVPKRNFIRRALKYNPTVCELDDKTVAKFLEMEEKWCNMKSCSMDKQLFEEEIAVKEALQHYRELSISGVCVEIHGRIEAFAVGEQLNSDTWAEHFEKANPEFDGLYQFVLNEFAKSIPGKFKFLNREQDMGIEGLRKAKESYHPVKMVEKCRIKA